MKKLRVAVLANLKVNAPKFEDMSEDQWDDLDSEKTIKVMLEAIRSAGYDCDFLEGDRTLMESLPKFKPDICFNICEGHFGDSREAQVPALLEMLRIPYTGSRPLTLALALDKPMTKRILWWHELPTPAFQEFDRADESLNEDMGFPLFVKPSREGTSMGVSAKSIVKNEDDLREQVSFIINKYRQPALVETYVEGREITVGMVGNLVGPVARRMPTNPNAPRVQAGLYFLPPMEVNLKPFETSDTVYSNRLKVALAEELDYLAPAPIDDDTIDELNWLAAAVFRVMGAFDVSRVDFRLDSHDDGKPYILEINPLPGLSHVSDLVIEARADGIDQASLINMILEAGMKRYGLIS